MAQVPREELLEAGRKKLKDYQLRRRSTNTSINTTRDETMPVLTENGKKIKRQWRPTSLNIGSQVFAEEPGMLSPSTIASPRTLTAPPTPASPFMHTEQRESHDSLQGYPSPPLSLPASYMIRPAPTVSTPPPSSRLQQKGLQKLEQRGHQQQLVQQKSNVTTAADTKSRHERSQSSVVDYSAQFPSTWAYARSTSTSLRPVKNMDEALVWIQQNNRLVQENQRLKKELEEISQAHTALTRKLKEHEDQRKEDISNEQNRTNDALRRVRSEERARWAEIVERLERQVRQLQQMT